MSNYTYDIVPNPDKDFVKNLKKKIKSNNGFCPSKIEHIAENKCPCKEYSCTGNCLCGMYIKMPRIDDNW